MVEVAKPVAKSNTQAERVLPQNSFNSMSKPKFTLCKFRASTRQQRLGVFLFLWGVTRMEDREKRGRGAHKKIGHLQDEVKMHMMTDSVRVKV